MANITHLIRVSASASTLYPLVATPAGLARWWAEDVESDDPTQARLGFFNRATVYAIRREHADDARAVIWACESGQEWAGTRLEFELVPSGAETTVRFTHAAWTAPTDYFHSCNTVWGELMFRLKGEAEGRALGPLFGRTAMSY
jgi:hypothetical protein